MGDTRAVSVRPPPALLVLQGGAVLVVLAALPYHWFQLDRYTFVKELVLLAAASAAALLCLAPARRLKVFVVDTLIAGSTLLLRYRR